MVDNGLEMAKLGFSEEQKQYYYQNEIDINKKLHKMNSITRKRAKLPKCFACGKECTSFCKSHSVPRFCLKRIAVDGKVYFSGLQQDLPFLGEDCGVNEAGTFSIICNECDSKLFQDYEDPNAYENLPNGKMLAQMAMKNYLQMISKRLIEKQQYLLMKERDPFSIQSDIYLQANSLDLKEFQSSFNRAKIAASGGHDDWYYLCYHKKVDYVVPYATQGILVLVSDFEGNVINDVHNMNPAYHTRDLHFAVFPLENSSVIMLFIDSKEKRYRHFYRQLKNLQPEDQLSAINYLIHLYSENVFISKRLREDALHDPSFREACHKEPNYKVYDFYANPTEAAVADFSLSGRNSIPNLLSKEFALDS